MLGQFIQPGSTFVNFGTNYPQPSNVLFPKTLHIPLHTFLNFAPPVSDFGPNRLWNSSHVWKFGNEGFNYAERDFCQKMSYCASSRVWKHIIKERNKHAWKSIKFTTCGFFFSNWNSNLIMKKLGTRVNSLKNQTYDAKNKRLKFDWR